MPPSHAEQEALAAFVAASAACLENASPGETDCDALCEWAVALEIEHMHNLTAELVTNDERDAAHAADVQAAL